ncbi:pyridoxamine 5'-phosphate oxidase family protein [Thermomonospora amylolytica]|uniref:pyridoxamine 5'-phosphate oxidase family protein n=1 Tax=Thermomonospora amylolytica TaxID=1411117 RepID=UPI000E6B5C23|nr:pyridoxamine 5'-phosphate oxidase family protein [Thermomonospora amylolytica]
MAYHSGHPGEIAVQRRNGVTRDGWGSAGTSAAIPEVAAGFLRRQRLIAVGTAADDGTVWADAVTGPAGFVTTGPGDRRIVIDALPRLVSVHYEDEHDIGLIAIEPPTRRRMRANGVARRDGDRLVVRTEQVYSNCPKYIQTRHIVEDVPPRVPGEPVTGRSLTAAQREAVARADTFFIATHAPGHGTDVSHRGGNPGFVQVTGTDRLTWPEYVGNGMYMTLGNLELNPAAGLLFIDWERGDTLHLTGRARVDFDPGRAASVPGARQMVDFEIDRVVSIPGALALHWRFGEYHRFNPPVAELTP